jgi:hypothetical protein
LVARLGLHSLVLIMEFVRLMELVDVKMDIMERVVWVNIIYFLKKIIYILLFRMELA